MTAQLFTATSLSATGLLLGATLLPAGSAFAAGGCADGAELVADGICEVTFTETPDSAWTPPAGITKLQALLVGGGGAVGSTNEYGGGGGDVQLVELATTGEVTVTVGLGGSNVGNVSGTASSIAQGDETLFAEPGDNSGTDGDVGGDSGSGFQGDGYGPGGGAGGAGSDDAAGVGIVVGEIDPDFDLFANDDRCFGGGGIDINSWEAVDGFLVEQVVQDMVPACDGANGGIPVLPEGAYVWAELTGYHAFVGSVDDLEFAPTVANTGNGGASVRGLITHREDGADGVVILRYDTELAATGFDSTGAVAAATALVAGGVALAVRRRRNAR